MPHKLSDKAQGVVDEVIRKFETGDLSPVVNYIRIKRAVGDTGLPSDSWSFGNQILAFLSTGSEDARGFNQWKAVGRRVTKGAKAGYIFIPCTRKGEDEQTGEERVVVYGFKSVAVFGREDTEGADLAIESPTYEPEEFPPFIDVARAWNLRVNYTPNLDAWGSYSSLGKIRLATHEESVFFHELAHAAHHKIDGSLKGGQNAKQEAIAEFSACVLKAYCGLGDTSGKAWSYIQGYNPKNTLTALLGCLSKASEVIGLILDTADKIQAEKVAA